MGLLQGKPWGQSERMYLSDTVQVEDITVMPGGFSSMHKHARKTNLFIVRAGNLQVRLFGMNFAQQHETTLTDGMQYTVKRGAIHQFFAKSFVLATEVYWGIDIEPDDIERFSDNGRVQDYEYSDEPTPAQMHSDSLCCGCSLRLDRHGIKWDVVNYHGAKRQMCVLCQQRLMI